MTGPEARGYRLPRQVTDSVETRRDYLSSHLDWELGRAIGELSLPALVHPWEETKRLRTLHMYSLARIPPRITRPAIDHKGRTFYGCKVPEGVRTERTAYMPTPHAMGLIYRRVDKDGTRFPSLLAAICSLRVSPDTAQLQVVELQGNPIQTGEYVRGLSGGFWWRDTLVAAAGCIGERWGAPELEIQSAVNNEYWNRDDGTLREALVVAYDEVAVRMGDFTRDPETRNWRAPLPLTPPRPVAILPPRQSTETLSPLLQGLPLGQAPPGWLL